MPVFAKADSVTRVTESSNSIVVKISAIAEDTRADCIALDNSLRNVCISKDIEPRKVSLSIVTVVSCKVRILEGFPTDTIKVCTGEIG